MAVLLQNICLQFPGSAGELFSDLTLDVKRHEFLSLVGPSGCGKSSLLKLIAGLLVPDSGVVQLGVSEPGASDGVNPAAPRIGFVFQHPTLLPWRTAAQNLTLPLELNPSLTADSAKTNARISSMLNRVGLTDADAGKRPAEMSGGMQMRLSLARALIVDPDILLLDEPLAAVDDLLRLRLQEDVSRIHAEQRLTTVLVTHNLQEAAFLSDRVVILGGSPSTPAAEICISEPHPRTPEFRMAPRLFEIVNELTSSLFGGSRLGAPNRSTL